MADTADKAPGRKYNYNITETCRGDKYKHNLYLHHMEYLRMLFLFKCALMLLFHAPSISVRDNSNEVWGWSGEEPGKTKSIRFNGKSSNE